MVLPYDNMDYGEDQIGARNIPELTDVELTNLANGEILKYNSSNNKWENQPDDAGGGSLDNLTDTNITTPITNGSYLVYNTSNGKWENALLVDNDTDNLVDLTDTNISSVANNEILKYNSTSSKWENNNLLINEINDVNITSLQNGEVLKYNSGSGKWENQDNTDTLNELTDVTLTGSSNNQVLKYNGSIWVNNFVNLTELADTNIPALNNGDILRYNSVSQKWETDTFNIDDLDDVNITSVANNEILKYNSTTSKWENSNRIDTLDELGDVTLTGVTTGDLLRYNGTNFVNTKIALDNDFTNVNFTSLTNGDLIKYNGSNFINFAPTYLDGAGISDNFLIKVVSGATTQTSITETNTANSTNISFNNGSIETEIFNTTKKRMHLTTSGIATANGITITSDGRVGIGVVEPEEDLEVDGNIQLDTGGVQRGRVIFYDKQNDHEHAEVDGLGEGTNGGALVFYTKVDGGSVTEKLRINNVGAIGIGGGNYGNSGQVIVSNGSGSSVSWVNQTDTTYTQGTGVSINGSNVISIGQSVATSDSPSFNQLSLGVAGTNQGIINLKDFTNVGTDTIAQIKGILDGTNGGQLQIFTKVDGGSLTERLSIIQNGLVKITTDGVGLLIASQDGVTEQGYIYNSGFGTKDFVMDATVGSLAKGIAFRIGGNDKLKIGNNGELGIGGAFYGNSGQVIVSRGSGNPVEWADQTDTTYSAGTGVTINGSNQISIGQSVAPSDSPTFINLTTTNFTNNGNIRNVLTGSLYRVDMDGYGRVGFNYNGVNHATPGVNNCYFDGLYGYGWCRNGFSCDYLGINTSSQTSNRIFLDGVYGHIYYKGSLISSSDDRLKINEKSIPNALNTINNINFYEYDKVDTKDGDDIIFKERGVIAQEILNIEDISYAVIGTDEHYSVAYQNIFITACQAIKDLSAKVAASDARIAALEAQLG